MSKKRLSHSVARATSEGPHRTAIRARKFTFYTDVPEQSGGTDQGSTPVEMLLGTLAGCLNGVGHVAAERLGLEIKDLKITVTGQLDPDGIFGPPDVSPHLQIIDVDIDLDMDADEETRQRWLELTEANCPVAATLSRSAEMHVHLK